MIRRVFLLPTLLGLVLCTFLLEDGHGAGLAEPPPPSSRLELLLPDDDDAPLQDIQVAMPQVSAQRQRTDFTRVAAEVVESAYEVRVVNGGSETLAVALREVFASDWLVISESAPHVREAPNTIRWDLAAPAGGEAVLRYRVRVRD